MNKDKTLNIRISTKDLNYIKQKSQKAKLTITDYVTKCALNKTIYVYDGYKEFLNELLIANTNYPELKMYKIWKLKFKDKLTITEIANRLHKDKDEIITSLKKIIDLAEK